MENDFEHLILTFGLTDEQLAFVHDNLPFSDYKVDVAECATDFIAFPYWMGIIDVSVTDANFLEEIFGYYQEIGCCTSEVIILLGDAKIPPEFKKVFRCYESFDDIRNDLKYIMLAAYKRVSKARAYSKQLVNALRILAKIRECAGITSKELAEYNECSVRSVQRYIESLRIAGEFIEYDRNLKGWKLLAGRSMFFGEVCDTEWD